MHIDKKTWDLIAAQDIKHFNPFDVFRALYATVENELKLDFTEYIRSLLCEIDLETFEPLFTEPIFRYLDNANNRFRAGLSLILGDDAGYGAPKMLAGISELAWASILIKDDIGDGDTVRRSQPTVSFQEGCVTAVHLSDTIFDYGEKVLSQYGSAERFRRAIRFTDVGQIVQENLDIELSTIEQILSAYKAKSYFGRWALEEACSNNKELFTLINQVEDCLCVAGQIKDDIQDYMIESDFKSRYKDIDQGLVTWPILVLRDKLKDNNGLYAEFMKKFTSDKLRKDYAWFVNLLKEYKVIEEGIKIMNQHVDSAQQYLEEAKLSRPVYLILTAWSESYRYIDREEFDLTCQLKTGP